MNTTTSPSEWAAAFCLGTALWASCAAVIFALTPVDFTALAHRAALTTAALLMLLSLAAPEATR